MIYHLGAVGAKARMSDYHVRRDGMKFGLDYFNT